MAQLHMQRMMICALKKDRKQILELLQRKGVIEIDDHLSPDQVFGRTDNSIVISKIDKTVTAAKEAYEILASFDHDKTSMLSALKGRKQLTLEEYQDFSTRHEEAFLIAQTINRLSKSIDENNAEILRLETQIEMLTPWLDLDVPLDYSGSKRTKCYIGSLPGEWSRENIYEILAEASPADVTVISKSKEQTCIFVTTLDEVSDQVFKALREADFSYPSIMSEKAPDVLKKELAVGITSARNEIAEATKQILSYSERKEDLLFLQDYYTTRSDKYKIIGHLLQSKNVFVLTGYIARNEAQELSNTLVNQFVCAVDTEEPGAEEDVPVLLKNNAFSRPLEGIVTSYSPPARGEFDPTFIMSLFYYMLFGLMLSDAGYGLLMATGTGIAMLIYRKTMEESTKNMLRMYFFCGMATIFWGVLFGSYFGDMIDVVSEMYFGKRVTVPALWFIPLNQPMRMMTFSLMIGVIHLFTGLVIKVYILAKKKDFRSMLYDVIFWIMLLASSVILLISMQMVKDILGVNPTIPQWLINVCKLLAIFSAIGIVLTNGRESKNPLKRFLKGLYALYGISGYLSDVLSYSRLLGLGLATGVIAMVMNKMAGMAASSLGPVVFIIIFVVGHLFNLAINALGSYVHTNRLQYVEFFGKFYEGGGRLFAPFHMKTKYYKIKERD